MARFKNQIMEKYKQLNDLLATVEADFEKFYNGGNGAAGTRIRKAMQELKVLAQEIRTEVSTRKNSDK